MGKAKSKPGDKPAYGKKSKREFANDFEVSVHGITLPATPRPRSGSFTVSGSGSPNSNTPIVSVSMVDIPITVGPQSSAITSGAWSVTFTLPPTGMGGLPATGGLSGTIRATVQIGTDIAMAVRHFDFG